MVVRPPPSRKGSFLYHHEDPRGRSDSFGLQGGKGTEQPVSSTQLWISHDNDTDQDGRNDAAGAKKKLSTAGRVGGRWSPYKNKKGAFALLGWLIGAAAPLCLLWIVFQNLFGGDDSSSFLYYQSSVFESNIVGEDGKAERSRKESVRTNIPSLIQPAQGQDQRDQRRLLLESPDAAFDQALDREMARMFKDFF